MTGLRSSTGVPSSASMGPADASAVDLEDYHPVESDRVGPMRRTRAEDAACLHVGSPRGCDVSTSPGPDRAR